MILIVLITATVIMSGGPKVSSSNKQAAAEYANLEKVLTLTSTVLSKKFCAGDAQVATLQVKLRLQFTNRDKKRIILYKGSGLVSSLALSKDIADAVRGKHELVLPFTNLSSSAAPITEKLDNRFLVLRPGSSFETETNIAIPVALTNESIPGAINSGHYFLKLRIVTWPESDERARTLRRKWRQNGYLWDEVIESSPMPITIESHPHVERC